MPPVGQTIMGGDGASDPLFLNAPSQEVLNANKDQAIKDELGRLRAEASKVGSRSQEENRLWTAFSRRSPFTSIWEKQTAEMTNVGLNNPGALCYRNVVFQIIANCPAIYHWCVFYKSHHIPHDEVCFKGENQSTCRLCLLTNFLEHYWDDREGTDFHDKVEELWEIVYTDWAKESKEGQQDPAELFMEMIHQFAADIPEPLRRDWQEICNSEFTTARLCKGTKPCEKVQYKPSPDKNDGWPVFSIQFGEKSKAANVQQAFEEHLNDTTDIGKCTDCGGKTFEKEYFTKPPEVLVLQINRIGEDGKKIKERLKFSEKLKIYTDYFDPRSNVAAASNIEYELTSVVFHAGETTSSGHYTVMVKGRTGKWTFIDDDRASPANYPAFGPDNQQQQDAYMFVYTRLPRNPMEEKLTRYNNIFGEEIISRKRPRSPGPLGSESNKKHKNMLDWSNVHRHIERIDRENGVTISDSDDDLTGPKLPKRRPFEPESQNNLALQNQLEETQRQLEETQKQLVKMQEQWERDQAKLRKSQERITATQDRLEQSLNQHAQIITAYDPAKGPDTVSTYSLISADQLDGAFYRALKRWQQESGSSGVVQAPSVSAYEERLDEAIRRIERIQPVNNVSVSGSVDSSEIQEAVNKAMQNWPNDNQPAVKVIQAPDGTGFNSSDVTKVVKETFEKCLSDQSNAFRADFASKKDISEEIKRAMKSWQEKDGKEFLKSVRRASTSGSGSGSGSGSTQATNPPVIDLNGPKMTKDNFQMKPHTEARAFDNKTGFLRIQYFEYHNGNDKNPNPNKEYKVPLDFAVRGYPINLKENAMESGLNSTLLSLIKHQKSTKKIVTKSAAMRSSTTIVQVDGGSDSGSDDDSSDVEEESDSESGPDQSN